MCLIALIGFALPRFALFLMWIFSDRLSIAFDSFVLGFVGFLLLPYTTFFYALAYNPIDGVTGFGWFVVVFGFIVDITTHTGGGRAARERRRAGL
jgi:hypothetical protein